MGKHDDPEQYIRDLERRVGQPPETPEPSGAPLPEWTSGRRPTRLGKLVSTKPRRILLIIAVAPVLAIVAYLANHYSTTTVQGHLIMLDSGATGKVDCNNGILKFDGDKNTYTVIGHCQLLEVAGSANKVTVDSADTISIIGDDNAVTYHSGVPTINKTGTNNIVAQRQSSR